MLTFDPLSLKMISTSRILPNCWKMLELKLKTLMQLRDDFIYHRKSYCDAAWRWEIHTPNIWRRSGSLKRNGMLETWRRLGWALFAPSSSLPLPVPPPDGTDALRDWGSEVTGARASSWQRESRRYRRGGARRKKNRMDKEEEDMEEQTTRERWETKDGRIKECEWGGKWRQEEGIRRKGKKEKGKNQNRESQFKSFRGFWLCENSVA